MTNEPGINRIALISDAPDQLGGLINWLENENYEITVAASVVALVGAADDDWKLVLLDVATEQVLPALEALRRHPLFFHATILVRAERIPDPALLAGICPTYRALICYHEDIITLSKHSVHASPEQGDKHLF